MISNNGLRPLLPDHSNFNIRNYSKFAFVKIRCGSKKKVSQEDPNTIFEKFLGYCYNVQKRYLQEGKCWHYFTSILYLHASILKTTDHAKQSNQNFHEYTVYKTKHFMLPTTGKFIY